MKEERIEILKMVADKKITVEEGERLLRALEKGEAEERESRCERFGPKHRGPYGRGDWSLGDSFEGFGFKAQEFFENAFGSLFGDEYWFEGYEPARGVRDLSLVPDPSENEPSSWPALAEWPDGWRSRRAWAATLSAAWLRRC